MKRSELRKRPDASAGTSQQTCVVGPAGPAGPRADRLEWRNRIVRQGMVDPEQLLAHPLNWRIHPKHQQDALRGVLREVGMVQNVMLQEGTDVVIDGHLRVALALSEGQGEVAAHWVDLTDEEARLVLATLDPLSALAGTDHAKLGEVLDGLRAQEREVAGFLDRLAREYRLGPAAEPAVMGESRFQVEPGQLWVVPSRTGRYSHRVLCADSLEPATLDRLRAGAPPADLLLADPPYNVGMAYGTEQDDRKDEAEYERFTRTWFERWRPAATRAIVTPGSANLGLCYRLFAPAHLGIWLKENSRTHGWISRFHTWEPLLFYGERWSQERTQDTFAFPTEGQAATAHPCPKPLALWEDLLRHYCPLGGLVLDPFGGSGSTLVAAERTGRLGYTVELEPSYCALALERLARLGCEPRLVPR